MNPMNMVMNALQNNMKNPMASSIMQMVQNNDTNGLENMARNMCEANGTTLEQAMIQAKKYFGMK